VTLTKPVPSHAAVAPLSQAGYCSVSSAAPNPPRTLAGCHSFIAKSGRPSRSRRAIEFGVILETVSRLNQNAAAGFRSRRTSAPSLHTSEAAICRTSRSKSARAPTFRTRYTRPSQAIA
jgi:hypothetical protein